MKLITNLSKIGSADIIGSGITAIFWFLIASWASPADFGELNYYLGIAGIASFIVMFGTQNTITVYVAKNIPIHTTLYAITFFLFVPASIILFLLFNRIDILILTLAYTIGNLSIGEIFGNRNYNSYLIYIIIQKSLTFVLGILFFNQFGANGLILALALTHIPYAYRIVKDFKNTKVDFSLLKKRYGFIINNYAISLTYGLNGQIDKLIVMPLLGASILGNYSLALQVIAALMTIPAIIFKYILPQESHGKNIVKAKRLLILSSILITLVGFFIIPEIIPKVFPKFNETIDAIKIMSISITPISIVKIYTSRFLSMEKSKFILITHVISVSIMVVSMIILGNIIGLNGIAASFVISTLTQAICLFLINKKNFTNYEE